MPTVSSRPIECCIVLVIKDVVYVSDLLWFLQANLFVPRLPWRISIERKRVQKFSRTLYSARAWCPLKGHTYFRPIAESAWLI